MDQLDIIRCYLLVVEEGSFTSAARRLGKSTSAVTRQISTLESRLGVPLINRNTRQRSLTDAGSLYYQRMKDLVGQLDESTLEIQRAHEAVEGEVRVAMRTSPAVTIILPALPKFFEKYPGVQLDIQVTDDRQDLIANNIDVAVWVCDLPDSGLITRRLSSGKLSALATPDYLARYGTPKKPSDLRNHNCIINKKYGSTWWFTRGEETVAVDVSGSVKTDCGLATILAAKHGIGILISLESVLRPEIENGQLCRVLEDYVLAPTFPMLPINVVFPSGRNISKRVRVFVDFLVALFEQPAN